MFRNSEVKRLALGAAVLLQWGCVNGNDGRDQTAVVARQRSSGGARASASGDTPGKCQPVESPTVSGSQISPPRGLVGSYELTVVAQGGATSDSAVTGTLELDSTTAIPAVPNSAISLPLSGTSSVDLTRVGPVSLVYSPSSRDPVRPGVQVLYNSATHTYTMIFGNALSPRGTPDDAGVYFDVVRIGPDGFDGRWNGGRHAAKTRGYFCARRVGVQR